MKPGFKAVSILALALLGASCGREATTFPALIEAEAITIMALGPLPEQPPNEPAASGAPEMLHGHAVLRSAEVADAEARREIFELIDQGIADCEGTSAACFEPSFGIRARTGDAVTELLMSYGCLKVGVYEDGQAKVKVLTSQKPRTRLAEIWAAQGVPVQGD